VIHRRRHACARRVVDGIRHDADDRPRLRQLVATNLADALTDGVTAREEAVRERLIDDDLRLALWRVRRSEIPPGTQRHAVRLEPVRRDDVAEDVTLVF